MILSRISGVEEPRAMRERFATDGFHNSASTEQTIGLPSASSACLPSLLKTGTFLTYVCGPGNQVVPAKACMQNAPILAHAPCSHLGRGRVRKGGDQSVTHALRDCFDAIHESIAEDRHSQKDPDEGDDCRRGDRWKSVQGTPWFGLAIMTKLSCAKKKTGKASNSLK